MGTVGDAYDNVLIESFWARLHTELLNRKRIELSTALFDHLEIFHNHEPTPQRARDTDTSRT